MRLVPLLALLSCGSLLCAAQTSAKQGTASQSVIVVQTPNGANCPVGFQARHAQDGGLVQVSPGQRHPGQGYQLTFSSLGGHGIAEAKVTLHGLAGAHVIPAGRRDFPDATESFNLSPSGGGTEKLLFHSTVYTEKLTGVQWIELNEVTYADGTRWHESPTATCRVAPNGFMLVTAGK